jgi:magnesium transporter
VVRLPWLLVTLFGGFLTSVILRAFHAQISQIVALAYFVPIVLAMGGNTGIQSSTLVVRSIALGTLEGRNIFRILFKEILAGALMGSACGLIVWMWARFLMEQGGGTAPGLAVGLLAAVVGVALFAAMTFAASFGALVPIVLNRLRVDPAVASGPFVTITNDIAALLIYFGVTILMVYRLG